MGKIKKFDLKKGFDGLAGLAWATEGVHQKGTPDAVTRRRAAAIPLDDVPASSNAPSLSTVTAVSGSALCVGYILKRRCQAKKVRRDSFGFLPTSRRSSLN